MPACDAFASCFGPPHRFPIPAEPAQSWIRCAESRASLATGLLRTPHRSNQITLALRHKKGGVMTSTTAGIAFA